MHLLPGRSKQIYGRNDPLPGETVFNRYAKAVGASLTAAEIRRERDMAGRLIRAGTCAFRS